MADSQVCNATAAAAVGATVPNLGNASSNMQCRECPILAFECGIVRAWPLGAALLDPGL